MRGIGVQGYRKGIFEGRAFYLLYIFDLFSPKFQSLANNIYLAKPNKKAHKKVYFESNI